MKEIIEQVLSVFQPELPVLEEYKERIRGSAEEIVESSIGPVQVKKYRDGIERFHAEENMQSI